MAINSWDKLLGEIITQQREKFPDVSAPTTARCLLQKCGELMHDPFDMERWADVLVLVLQGADRIPIDGLRGILAAPDELLAAVRAKLERNKVSEHSVSGDGADTLQSQLTDMQNSRRLCACCDSPRIPGSIYCSQHQTETA